MRRDCAAIVVLAGLAASPTALAQTKTWDGDAGNQLWFQDTNWNPDGVPGVGDSVLVQSAGPVVCQSNTIHVLSAIVENGLIVDNGGLVLGGSSQITGLTVQGCCTAVVESGGLLTIDGVSAFLTGVRFQGSGETTVGGTAFFDDDLFVEGGHIVALTGQASTDDSIDPRNGSEVVIEGTLEMLPGAAFRGSSGGLTRNRGLVRLASPGDVWVFGTMRTEGGTVLAEEGVFHLSGDNPVSGGTLDTREFAEIVVDSIAAPEISSSSFTGEGAVTLRSGSALYTGRVESHLGGAFGRAEIRGRCRIDGQFVNYGTLEFNGATLESPAGVGRYEERGASFVINGMTLQLPLSIMSGGKLTLESALTVQQDVTVEAGGEISTESTAGYLSGTPGRVHLGGTLRIAHPDFANLTMTAPVDLQAGGRIRALSGNTNLRSDLVWSGGTLEASGLSTKVTVGEAGRTLSVVGDVEVTSEHESVHIGPSTHTLEIEDRLRVTSGDNQLDKRVFVSSRITGAGTLENSGSMWIWDNASIGAAVNNTGYLTLYGPIPLLDAITNSREVVQSGDLAFDQGAVDNSGTWRVSVSGNESSRQRKVTDGLITNTGLYEVVRQGGGNATHTVEVRFDNRGTVRAVNTTARFLDVAQILGGVLDGGTWEAGEFGGRIEFPGSAVDTIGPGTTVVGSTASLPWMGGATLIDAGAWRVVGDSTLTLPLDVRGGSVDVETGQTDAPRIDVRDGGRLGVGEGAKVRSADRIKIHSVLDDIDGIVPLGLLPAPAVIETPLLDLGGRMRPGGPGRAGQIDVLGEVVCMPSAEMVFDVGGADNTDVLTTTGPVTFGGATLTVELIDEFTPQGGESFRLIDTLGGVFGEFAVVNLPPLSGGLDWEFSYGETGVWLGVVGGPCEADWNADGTVNTLDFLAYLGDWSAGDPAADLNGDGTVNTIDFLAFLGLWSAGC